MDAFYVVVVALAVLLVGVAAMVTLVRLRRRMAPAEPTGAGATREPGAH